MGKRRTSLILRRKCDKCSLRFFSHFCLLLHLRVHEKVYSGWFRCSRCEKRFENLVGSVKHRQRHVAVKVREPPEFIEGSQLDSSRKENSIHADFHLSGLSSADIPGLVCHKQQDEMTEDDPKVNDKEILALKFIEQLKAALCLDGEIDTPSSTDTQQKCLQIAEVSSSANLEYTENPCTAFPNSTEKRATLKNLTTISDKDVISTSCGIDFPGEVSKSGSMPNDIVLEPHGICTSGNNSNENLSDNEASIQSNNEIQETHMANTYEDPGVKTSEEDILAAYQNAAPSGDLEFEEAASNEFCNANLDGTSNASCNNFLRSDETTMDSVVDKDEFTVPEKKLPCMPALQLDSRIIPGSLLVLNDATSVNGIVLPALTAPKEPFPFSPQMALPESPVPNICSKNQDEKDNRIRQIDSKLGKQAVKEISLTEERCPRKYACCFCKAKFACFSRLRRHKRIVHNKVVTICSDYLQPSKNAKKITSEVDLNFNASEMSHYESSGKRNILQTEHPFKDDYLEKQSNTISKSKNISGSSSLPMYAVGADEGDLYECKLCDATFLTSYGERQHMLKRHSQNNNNAISEVVIGTDMQLSGQTRILSSTEKIRDPLSSTEKIKDPPHLVEEELTESYLPESAILCNHCGFLFNSLKQQRQHLLQNHGMEVTFENETFVFFEDQQSQLPSAESYPMIGFKMANVIKDSKNVFHNSAKNRCQICKTGFSSWHSLKRHMMRTHNISIDKPLPVHCKTDNLKSSQRADDKKAKTLLEVAKSVKVVEMKMEQKASATELRERRAKSTCENSTQLDIVVPDESQSNFLNETIPGRTFDKASWKANFSQKSFVCLSCDFRFSGFFILKKHMTEYHDILLDSRGNEMKSSETKKIDIHEEKKSQEEPHENNSFIRVSSVTNLVEHSTDIDIDDQTSSTENYESPTVIPLARNKNGQYHCPHCTTEFKSLIDRYIHIVDIHNKSSVAQSSPTPANKNGESGNQSGEQNGVASVPVPSSLSSKDANDTDKPETLACPVCESTFESLRSLKMHTIRNHSLLYSNKKRKKSQAAVENNKNDSGKNNSSIKPSSNSDYVAKRTTPNDISGKDDNFDNTIQSALAKAVFNCQKCNETFSSWKDKCQHMVNVHKVKLPANTARKSITPARKADKHAHPQTKDSMVLQEMVQSSTPTKFGKVSTLSSKKRKKDADGREFVPVSSQHVDPESFDVPISKGMKKNSTPKSGSRESKVDEKSPTQNPTEETIADSSQFKKPKIDRVRSDNHTFLNCKICLRSYCSMGSLSRHMRDIHGCTNIVFRSKHDGGAPNEPISFKRQHISKQKADSSKSSSLKRARTNQTDHLGTFERRSLWRDIRATVARVRGGSKPNLVSSENNKRTDSDTDEAQDGSSSSLELNGRGSSYRCSKCKKTFETSKEWEEHDRQYRTDHRTCEQRERGSSTTYTVEKVNATGQIFPCNACGVEFQHALKLQRHMLFGKCNRQYVCGIPGCAKEFGSRSGYKQHIQNTCTLCHSQLSNEKGLQRHYKSVHKIKSMLSCDVCAEKFVEPVSLAIHNREKHMAN